ncbi:MAG TPA: YCF48-related protein [Candidatus Angelobacter sp.]
MPELSNLLRQRLAATENGGAQVHPDADTLTAYMEQSLPSTESQTVVAHLAVCEPCREVVVLSQSLLAEPATQTVLAPAPVSRWRRLLTPAFGAAASLVAMAVIAVMVLQLPQKHSQQSLNPQTPNRQAPNPPAQETQQAQSVPVEDKAAPAKAKAAVPAETHSASVGGLDLAVRAREANTQREAPSRAKAEVALAPAASIVAPATTPPPAKMAVLTAGLQKKDYVNTNFFISSGADNVALDGQGNSLPAAPQPQPSAASNPFNTSNSKITMFADLPANAAGKSNVRILTPVPPQEHFGFALGKIMQSTARTLRLHSPVGSPALRDGALSSSALGGPGMFSGAIEKSQPTEVLAAPERKDADSFTASGSLSPSAMAPSGSRSSDSASPTWKVASGKLMKSAGPSQWEDAYPVASSIMEFSFVSVRGNDVWAGGSHASMIHSRDGGLTWDTIKLGDSATGTIVSIIAGTMSVQVKTSDNQTWSTADGGKTWTLRGE